MYQSEYFVNTFDEHILKELMYDGYKSFREEMSNISLHISCWENCLESSKSEEKMNEFHTWINEAKSKLEILKQKKKGL